MRLSAVRVPVTDLIEAAEFYTLLLDAQPDGGGAGDGYLIWHLDNADLIVEPEEPGEFDAGRFLGLSLAVDDIQAFYQAGLDRDIEFTGPPEPQEWGGILAHVEDPDGNFFSVVQSP